MNKLYPCPVRFRGECESKIAAIRTIADLEQRNTVARRACLDLVTKAKDLDEIWFLSRCGINLDDSEGPALRVKKTRHGIRTNWHGEQKNIKKLRHDYKNCEHRETDDSFQGGYRRTIDIVRRQFQMW